MNIKRFIAGKAIITLAGLGLAFPALSFAEAPSFVSYGELPYANTSGTRTFQTQYSLLNNQNLVLVCALWGSGNNVYPENANLSVNSSTMNFIGQNSSFAGSSEVVQLYIATSSVLNAHASDTIELTYSGTVQSMARCFEWANVDQNDIYVGDQFPSGTDLLTFSAPVNASTGARSMGFYRDTNIVSPTAKQNTFVWFNDALYGIGQSNESSTHNIGVNVSGAGNSVIAGLALLEATSTSTLPVGLPVGQIEILLPENSSTIPNNFQNVLVSSTVSNYSFSPQQYAFITQFIYSPIEIPLPTSTDVNVCAFDDCVIFQSVPAVLWNPPYSWLSAIDTPGGYIVPQSFHAFARLVYQGHIIATSTVINFTTSSSIPYVGSAYETDLLAQASSTVNQRNAIAHINKITQVQFALFGCAIDSSTTYSVWNPHDWGCMVALTASNLASSSGQFAGYAVGTIWTGLKNTFPLNTWASIDTAIQLASVATTSPGNLDMPILNRNVPMLSATITDTLKTNAGGWDYKYFLDKVIYFLTAVACLGVIGTTIVIIHSTSSQKT